MSGRPFRGQESIRSLSRDHCPYLVSFKEVRMIEFYVRIFRLSGFDCATVVGDVLRRLICGFGIEVLVLSRVDCWPRVPGS